MNTFFGNKINYFLFSKHIFIQTNVANSSIIFAGKYYRKIELQPHTYFFALLSTSELLAIFSVIQFVRSEPSLLVHVRFILWHRVELGRV